MTSPPDAGTGSSEIDARIDTLIKACNSWAFMEGTDEDQDVACAALIAKVREVVRDAERYRWLKERAYCDSREQFVDGFNVAGKPGGYAEFADESVDAAISAGKQGEGT